ncbi:hypothetical protein GLOIN_2v461622 [Rhizophagus clarus]|uniref:HTH myb-type domain-containing protein n=1 Tax=Rhizophagus clarus TaxID=94130 RepID=A0A8H3MIT1_9GLOM|nr:hypothetical protein GLOIN_2v461622 [Rhizophagus clarus]
MPLFSNRDNKNIKFLMRLWGKCNDRFVKISRFMPHRNAKQISHHWRNYLNPNLCKQPLGYDEKIYIVTLVQKYRTSDNIINWKYVIKDLKIRSGKLYAENQVKNYWNSRSRSNSCDDNNTSLRLPIMEPIYVPKFNNPFRMRPY